MNMNGDLPAMLPILLYVEQFSFETNWNRIGNNLAFCNSDFILKSIGFVIDFNQERCELNIINERIENEMNGISLSGCSAFTGRAYAFEYIIFKFPSKQSLSQLPLSIC